MRVALLSPALMGFFLVACAEKNVEMDAPSVSASSSAAVVPAKPTVKRKTTPTELRVADEKACLAGNADACRRMADRYRGYGHTAGCGIDRAGAALAHGRVVAPISVRIKRAAEDEDRDKAGLLEWMAKACDLGESKACDIERSVRSKFEPDSNFDKEAIATRSDPTTSAVMSFHSLWQSEEHVKFLDLRKKCLTKRYSCSALSSSLFTRRKEETRPELTPELITKLQAICDQTLDCDSVLMMLDKHGYPPEALAPIRAHASKSLVQACVEGSCVCGDAAASLPADDPRIADLARWGCENGEAAGCYLLGKLHEEGRGVDKDEDFARSLYETACPPTKGYADYYTPEYSPRACQRMAEIAQGGLMPPKDKDRAVYYAEYGCLRPGYERDHAPCVTYSRYWANGVLTSVCRPEDASWCRSSLEQAEDNFHGKKSSPADGKECERPSVKAICDAHVGEIEAKKKPAKKK